MLNCNEVLTVVQKEYDSVQDMDVYRCTLINGASWFKKSIVQLEETGLKSVDVIKIRIPAKNMPDMEIKVNDYVVRGSADGIRKAEDIEKYEYCAVKSMADNRRGGIPHVAVTGA